MKSVGNTRPEWAEDNVRLDPYALPQQIRREHGSQRTHFTLSRNGATVKTLLSCGLPLSMALPSRAFAGVAARAFDNEDGTTTVTLELLHADPHLCLPLCVSDTPEDAACDWHSWAKRLGLPMLMVDAAGNIETVKNASGITSREPRPRRRRAALKHRPNFLRRRKMGIVGPVERLSAREIIART